jgi:GntR family transcriptional repressor for pyruvate dehydrogenase complex
MAMERASQEDIDAIGSAIDRLEKAIQESRQTVEDDLAFHRAILQSTHNPLVARVGETILELFKPSIHQTITHFPEEALRNHKQVFEAFREKDEHKLKDAVIQSFDVWKSGLNLAKEDTEK